MRISNTKTMSMKKIKRSQKKKGTKSDDSPGTPIPRKVRAQDTCQLHVSSDAKRKRSKKR